MLSDLIYCSIYFDFKEQDFFNIYRTLFDRGIAGWWQLLFPEVVKETFLSHLSGVTLAVTLPPLQTVPAGNKVPSQWVAPVTPWVPLLACCTPHTHSQRKRFLTSSVLGFPQLRGWECDCQSSSWMVGQERSLNTVLLRMSHCT